MNTALPSSVTETVVKFSQPSETVFTISASTSASTESNHYQSTAESSSPSPVTNASPSSSTRNIEDDENSFRYNIEDPVPQSPLFVSSSERFLSRTSEKTPVKIYPSSPGVATTVPNVFYVNAQPNYNSTTVMLQGFESYLKDYLNANEVKSNDIDSNFKVISDKNELEKLIKNAGNEYEVIKLSDIMAEKKRKESEKLNLESTTPGILQIQDSIYTHMPSTYSTRNMETAGTTAQGSTSTGELGLMKYYEDKDDKIQYNSKKGDFENENLNSFVDKHSDPDSANSELSNLKSPISQQFATNYGEKTRYPNTTPNTNSPAYGSPVTYYTQSSSSFSSPSTEVYYGSERNFRDETQSDNSNQYEYYQNINVPKNEGPEQIYFKELPVETKSDKSGTIVYSNIPPHALNVENQNAFYAQLQSSINQKQQNYNNKYETNNQEEQSSQVPIPFKASSSPERYSNLGLSNNIQTSTQSNLYEKPPPNTKSPTYGDANTNNTNMLSNIVFQSNGESGHMMKTENYQNVQTIENSGTTISDIEAAKVDQLLLTTPKTVSKKEIDNNKIDDAQVERQNLHEMASYTTTIEVFKSVPVEQYVIPDIPPGIEHKQKYFPDGIKSFPQIQINQNAYQGHPIVNDAYPFEQLPAVQKTILQSVYPTTQREPLFRPDPSYVSNEQKYYTDQLVDTKVLNNNQEPLPIPLNYGLKDLPTGHLSYRTPLSHQLQSIQQYGVPQYSVFTNSLSPNSMTVDTVVHPSYSISVNPLPLHQIQQQMVRNSVPYASQYYPNYIPADFNISQPNLINPGPSVNSPVKYYQPEKSISSEVKYVEPYYYPKPIHNPFEYPAKSAYNHKTRLVPVAQHFNIPTTVLHLVRTPYKSTLNKLKATKYYNPHESHYLKEMYNYAPQYSKENYRYDGHNAQYSETIHYDGRSKHAPFRPSFPMYDSVYPPMAYYETQYMAPNEGIDFDSNTYSNNNYRRPHVRSIRRPPSTNGGMKKLMVEYGGFKPPMIPSTEIKDGDVQTSSTEK